MPHAHDERLELIAQQRMQRFDLRHRDCMLQQGAPCFSKDTVLQHVLQTCRLLTSAEMLQHVAHTMLQNGLRAAAQRTCDSVASELARMPSTLSRTAPICLRCSADVVSGEPSPSADVVRGGPSPSADVAAVSPVPAQMWAGGEPMPTSREATHGLGREVLLRQQQLLVGEGLCEVSASALAEW